MWRVDGYVYAHAWLQHQNLSTMLQLGLVDRRIGVNGIKALNLLLGCDLSIFGSKQVDLFLSAKLQQEVVFAIDVVSG